MATSIFDKLLLISITLIVKTNQQMTYFQLNCCVIMKTTGPEQGKQSAMISSVTGLETQAYCYITMNATDKITFAVSAECNEPTNT